MSTLETRPPPSYEDLNDLDERPPPYDVSPPCQHGASEPKHIKADAPSSDLVNAFPSSGVEVMGTLVLGAGVGVGEPKPVDVRGAVKSLRDMLRTKEGGCGGESHAVAPAGDVRAVGTTESPSKVYAFVFRRGVSLAQIKEMERKLDPPARTAQALARLILPEVANARLTVAQMAYEMLSALGLAKQHAATDDAPVPSVELVVSGGAAGEVFPPTTFALFQPPALAPSDIFTVVVKGAIAQDGNGDVRVASSHRVVSVLSEAGKLNLVLDPYGKTTSDVDGDVDGDEGVIVAVHPHGVDGGDPTSRSWNVRAELAKRPKRTKWARQLCLDCARALAAREMGERARRAAMQHFIQSDAGWSGQATRHHRRLLVVGSASASAKGV